MADDVTPSGGGMPKTFGAKTSFMLGPLVLFLIVGVGISFAILWVMAGNLQEKLEKEEKRAQAAEVKLTGDLKKANDDLAAEQVKVKDLTDKHEKLRKEKEELAEGLKSAIGSLETVSSSLQKTSTALEDFKTTNEKTDAAQGTAIAENTQQIAYLKKEVNDRFTNITAEIGQMKHVDKVLQGEYVALRTDVNQTMQRGNVTEKELNHLSERSKIFQLRVLTARAKEAEQAAREGDLQKLLVKLNQE
jgi:chromosome segregation ATPase